MSLVRQSLRWGLSAALPRRRFVTRGPRGSGAVCLTFDDGPHPEHTPRVLDVLAELGVRATFFVIGEKAEKYPELLARMAAEGHAVGGHTWTHSEPRGTSTRVLMEETVRTAALVERVTKRQVTLFPPPKGELTASKLMALVRARQTVVLWNVDPKDYARASAAELVAWARQWEPRAGDIVLMHDVYPWAAEVLPTVAARVRNAGLGFGQPLKWSSAEAKAERVS